MTSKQRIELAAVGLSALMNINNRMYVWPDSAGGGLTQINQGCFLWGGTPPSIYGPVLLLFHLPSYRLYLSLLFSVDCKAGFGQGFGL